MILPYESICRCLYPLIGLEPVGGYTIKSVICTSASPDLTVTFPASKHHHSLTGTRLYCLVMGTLM